MKRLNEMLIIISLFFLLYNPVLYGISLLRISLIFVYIYLFLNYKSTLKIILNGKVLRILFFMIIIIAYLVLVVLINGTNLRNVFVDIYLITEVLPMTIFITVLMKKNSNFDFFQVLIKVGMIQAFCVFLAYINPLVHSFFIEQLIQAGYEFDIFLAGYRMYGFSTQLTYATPAVQALISIVAFVKIKKGELKYIIYFALLAFSALLNSRTSLAIVILGVLILALNYIRKSKNFILKLSLIILLILSIIGVFSVNETYNNVENVNIRWMLAGIYQIKEFFKGNFDTVYFSYLTNIQNYQLPKGLLIIIGTGDRVLGGHSVYNFASDIGYINDVWLGGVVYSLTLVIFVIINSFDVYKLSKEKANKFIILLISITMFILNFKGYIFTFNGYFNLFLLLLIYFTTNSEEKGGNNELESLNNNSRL